MGQITGPRTAAHLVQRRKQPAQTESNHCATALDSERPAAANGDATPAPKAPPLCRPRAAPAASRRRLLHPPPLLHCHRLPCFLRGRGLPYHHLPAQALRSSRFFAQFKAPSNADAVLAFLADAGLSKSDMAAAIARDPSLLRSQVHKTLSPRIGKLRDIGLSPDQISSLIALTPSIIRNPSMFPRLEFYISLLGSYEKVHTAIKRARYLLARDLERVVKPNLSFLRKCGLTESDIVKIFSLSPRMVTLEPECLRNIVACADGLGVSRSSAMFKYALVSVTCVGPERIKARRDLLKKALGCSEDELSIATRLFPYVLIYSVGKMSHTVEFLKTEVGLKVEYIVHRPALLGYSFEKRLKPRHHVLEVLKSKGLLEKDIDFFCAVGLTDERFAKKYVDPYKEIVPGLADGAALRRRSSSSNRTMTA